MSRIERRIEEILARYGNAGSARRLALLLELQSCYAELQRLGKPDTTRGFQDMLYTLLEEVS